MKKKAPDILSSRFPDRPFRASVAYGVVCLAVIVAIRLVDGITGLRTGGWMAALVFGIVAGYPVSLAVAWLAGSTEERARPLAGVWGAVGLGFVLLAAFIGVRSPAHSIDGAPEVRPLPEPTVVVLPLLELDGRAERTFADGFTHELVAGLSVVRGLEVRGRVSSAPELDVNRDAAAAGGRLGGGTVLDGTLRRTGSRVRLSVRLLDTATGQTLWTTSIDTTAAHMFGMRDEVVRGVAGALGLDVDAEATARLGRRRGSPNALDLYLLGRYRWAAGESGDLLEATAYYQLAIEADSSFAPAWTALAQAFATLPRFTRFPVRSAREDGAAAARTALLLDPDAAEAHLALGEILLLYERDWEAAASHLHRSIELDPGNAAPRDRLCEMRLILGEVEEARRACEEAALRDPDVFRIAWLRAGILSAEADHAGAVRTLDSLARVYPDFEPLAADLALARIVAEDTSTALATDLTIWFELLGDAEVADSLAGVLAAGGRGAREALARLTSDFDPDPAHRVALLSLFGQTDEAAALAGSTLVARLPGGLRFGVMPEYAALRRRQDVRAALDEAGLPVR